MDKPKNRYYRNAHISERKFREILKCFSLDITASTTAKLVNISIRSVSRIYLKLRRKMAEECEKQFSFSGGIELDESYFGAKRIEGKRRRGAGGKTPVFGLLM